jgi:hypothetical protein
VGCEVKVQVGFGRDELEYTDCFRCYFGTCGLSGGQVSGQGRDSHRRRRRRRSNLPIPSPGRTTILKLGVDERW